MAEREEEEKPKVSLGSIFAEIGKVAIGEILHTANQYLGKNFVGSTLDYSQAFLTIQRLLQELKGIEQYDVAGLIPHIPALVRVQKKHREHRLGNREEELKASSRRKRLEKPKELTPQEIAIWKIFVNHSVAAYGHTGIMKMGIVPSRQRRSLRTNEDCVSWATGIRKRDIKKFHSDDGLYMPGYFLAFDHKAKSVIVSIRGSSSVNDAIVDIVCEQREHIFPGDPEQTTGKVHVGFLIAAQNVDQQIRGMVNEMIEQYPKYQLIVTGHSLGGGVATLLGLMYVNVYKKRKVHCYAFAPPCSLCPAHAHSVFVKKNVTSIVVDDDVVCRLSLSTLIDIRRILYEFSQHANATDEEKYRLYHEIEREHRDKKLFPGGYTWVLDAELYDRKPTLVDQVEELASIQVTMSMIPRHLPQSYYNTVNDLE